MKIIVNSPDKDNSNILENRIADFHAILLIERIKKLNTSDKNKKEVLKSIENYLKDV